MQARRFGVRSINESMKGRVSHQIQARIVLSNVSIFDMSIYVYRTVSLHPSERATSTRRTSA